MTRKKAYTLAEVMVASGLTLLVLTLLVSIFVSLGQAMLRQSQQSEAQRAALLAVASMSEEVREADRESLYSADPSWYSFASWSQSDGSMSWTNQGELNWQRWDIFYFDLTQQKLFLQKQPISPPQPTLSPLMLESFNPTSQDRQVGRDISTFSCRVVFGSAILISLGTQVAGGHSQIICTLSPASTKPGSNPNKVLEPP